MSSPDTPSILVAGESLVDLYPDANGWEGFGSPLTPAAGGAPMNVAVALATLDSPPLFWTRVGADAFGDALRARLDEHGVPPRLVEHDSDRNTTLAFVDLAADVDFLFYEDATAMRAFELDDAVVDSLRDVSWVHLGGVLLSMEPARSAMVELVERASNAGCTVSFDPNLRAALLDGDDGEYGDAIRSILDRTDVLVATGEELSALDVDVASPDDLDVAGVHTVLRTQGESGAHGIAGSAAPWGPAECSVAGRDVATVDATGAGDAFVAAAIHGFVTLADPSLGAVVGFANAAGALATTDRGAQAALPSADEVRSILNGNGDT